jgi:hypothetical protein
VTPWLWFPIGVAAYITGIFVTGLFFAALYDPNNNSWKEDIIASIFTWPVTIWVALVYHIVFKRLSRGYMKMLNKKRDKKRKRIKARQYR